MLVDFLYDEYKQFATNRMNLDIFSLLYGHCSAIQGYMLVGPNQLTQLVQQLRQL